MLFWVFYVMHMTTSYINCFCAIILFFPISFAFFQYYLPSNYSLRLDLLKHSAIHRSTCRASATDKSSTAHAYLKIQQKSFFFCFHSISTIVSDRNRIQVNSKNLFFSDPIKKIVLLIKCYLC